ncbi:putative TIM-barrel fold metal-dependent hydrolase [Sphingomonas sp. PP-CE-1A-559]|uniref:amidohydrolase family protein n=1 Tax=Sphingomonas sp. PP-CE-1A-559 TaxID=2135657 RepID=UPI0010549805|nr:amidohydrolase family protein [Sphingomonas sp. PP-CE-1A-559]TCP86019.1 putative TIM-barrel fold metal-dependent hydrolase [Sphingomonas sp. PP-CE-1A-559]
MIRRIDAHHHLWDVDSGHHPMLSTAPVERFWGSSGELTKHYGIEAFIADARADDVVASVHVEAAFTPPEDEAAAMQAIADVHGFPQAFLTRIDLGSSDSAARIAADSAYANWRGIRFTAEWPAGSAPGRPARTPFADTDWRRGFTALGTAGGVADLMLWPEQLSEAAALARACPDTQIVIEHFALAGGGNADEAWDTGMPALADCPNVAVKLSGPGLVRRDWSADTIRPLILRLIALFGCDRLMIGSNAPVDLVMADYPTIVARFDAAIADRSDVEKQALWHDTAARIYRIAGER